MNKIKRLLCWLGLHDWRYASRYTRPGFESRARCQRCEARKWDRVSPAPRLEPPGLTVPFPEGVDTVHVYRGNPPQGPPRVFHRDPGSSPPEAP